MDNKKLKEKVLIGLANKENLINHNSGIVLITSRR